MTPRGLIIAAAVLVCSMPASEAAWTCPLRDADREERCQKWARFINSLGYDGWNSAQCGNMAGDPCGKNCAKPNGNTLQVTCNDAEEITSIKLVSGTTSRAMSNFAKVGNADDFKWGVNYYASMDSMEELDLSGLIDDTVTFEDMCTEECQDTCKFNPEVLEHNSYPDEFDTSAFETEDGWTNFDSCGEYIVTPAPTMPPTNEDCFAQGRHSGPKRNMLRKKFDSHDQCRQQCEEEVDDCGAYSYNSNNERCYWWKTKDVPETVAEAEGWTSGWHLCPGITHSPTEMPTAAPTFEGCGEEAKVGKGGLKKVRRHPAQIKMDTVEHCQTYCMNLDGCVWWNYKADGARATQIGKCYVYRTEPKRMVDDEQWISGGIECPP